MLVVTSKLCIEGIEYTRITRNNKAPESGGWSGCVVLACVGVCAVRPFQCGRQSHAACRAGRDRGASGRACAGSYNIQKPMTDSKVGWCSVL
jgi:hypothetical protein